MAHEIKNAFAERLKGFDAAVEDVKDTFENIADYIDIEDFEFTQAEIDFIADEDTLDEYTDDDLIVYNEKAIMIKLVKDTVLRCLEMARDDL